MTLLTCFPWQYIS